MYGSDNGAEMRADSQILGEPYLADAILTAPSTKWPAL